MSTKYTRVQGRGRSGSVAPIPGPAPVLKGPTRKALENCDRQDDRRADLIRRFRAKVQQPTGTKLEALARKRFRGYIMLLTFDGLAAVMEMPELPTWAAYAILHEVDSRAVRVRAVA